VTSDVITRDAPAPSAQPAAGEGFSARILVFSHTLVAAGAQMASIALANALAAGGHAVLFAADDGSQRNRLDRRVTYLPTDDARHAPVKTAHELSRYLRHRRPDVVHSFGARCALVAAIAVNASQAACIRVLTLESPCFRRTPRWIAGPLMQRCADHYFASDPDRRRELERLGVASERISLVSSPEAGSTAAAGEITVYRGLLAARTAKA
jgi:hypothetical protein